MAWPKLRKSPGTEGEGKAQKAAPPTPAAQRLKRLARKLDELPAKDELRIRQARELEEKQQQAGTELHALCRNLVESLNEVLRNMHLDLTPAEFAADMLDAAAGVLIQINASGRILQLAILTREPDVSTEHFRTPYILRGAVRWFNQEYLERQEIQEHQLFYVLDRNGGEWRYYDPRSRKMDVVDQVYLMETLEQLL